jgi:Ca2+/Na+ antiporter
LSIFSEIKSSASELKSAWSKLPAFQKSLDLYNLVNIGFFVTAFLVMVIFKYTRSVANATLLLLPLFLAGIGAYVRTRLGSDEEYTNDQATKELFWFSVIWIVIVAIVTIFYPL